MEIVLTGFRVYGIPEFKGSVEVSPFLLYQYKRVTGARSEVALFRKILKVFASDDSPVRGLPKELLPENLAFSDFLQLIIGCGAAHTRHTERIYTCKHCKALNPRTVDILKVFTPKAPVDESGKRETVMDDGTTLVSRYLTIGDYIKIMSDIEATYVQLDDNWKQKQIKALTERFGSIFKFADEEDLRDFREVWSEIGLIAVTTSFKDKPSTLDEMLIFLAKQQGGKVFDALDMACGDLSPSLGSLYVDKCINPDCGKEIREDFTPSEYFFASR